MTEAAVAIGGDALLTDNTLKEDVSADALPHT
jgi:hypothetical protein